LAITTDAPFHVPGALGVGDEYFTLDEVIDACNARAIKVTVSNCCEHETMYGFGFTNGYAFRLVSASASARHEEGEEVPIDAAAH